MSDRITRWLPAPKVVALAGRPWTVHEARLRDVRDLQAWLDACWSEAISAALDATFDEGLTQAQKDRRLYDALDTLGDAPPTYDSPEGRKRIYGTHEGVAAFVALALGRAQPLTPAEVVEVCLAMTPAEFDRLRRTWWGADPVNEARRYLMSGLPEAPAQGKRITLCEAVVEVAERYGLTDEQVLAMPLSTFRAYRHGGPPDDEGAAVEPSRLKEARAIQEARYRAAYEADQEPPRDDP